MVGTHVLAGLLKRSGYKITKVYISDDESVDDQITISGKVFVQNGPYGMDVCYWVDGGTAIKHMGMDENSSVIDLLPLINKALVDAKEEDIAVDSNGKRYD